MNISSFDIIYKYLKLVSLIYLKSSEIWIYNKIVEDSTKNW